MRHLGKQQKIKVIFTILPQKLRTINSTALESSESKHSKDIYVFRKVLQ